MKIMFVVSALALMAGCVSTSTKPNLSEVQKADVQTTVVALTTNPSVSESIPKKKDAVTVVKDYEDSHDGLITRKVLAKNPNNGIPCVPIPEDKTLVDVGIVPSERDINTPKSSFCMPPTAAQWKADEDYTLAYVSNPENYDTVFKPLSCQTADVATTGIGLANGFKEANPLGLGPTIALGYGIAKWTDNEAKKGNYGPAKGFCVVKIAAAIWNIGMILGL